MEFGAGWVSITLARLGEDPDRRARVQWATDHRLDGPRVRLDWLGDGHDD
jgi:hypothetical protein